MLPALLLTLLPGAARAAEPVVTVLEDGRTIEGAVHFQADVEAVRAVVRNPHETREAARADLTVTALSPDGDCYIYEWTIPTLVRTVGYSGRLCPSELGATVTLVRSRDFSEFDAAWEVDTLPDGRTRLVYRLRSVSSLPIPAAAARAQTQREVKETLENMSRSLAGK